MGKYSEAQFESFISGLKQVEKYRNSILQRLKEIRCLNTDKIMESTDLSLQEVVFNIEYLKELDLLHFIGLKSNFFPFKNYEIKVNQKKCISCFCCGELCGNNAISLRKPWKKISLLVTFVSSIIILMVLISLMFN